MIGRRQNEMRSVSTNKQVSGCYIAYQEGIHFPFNTPRHSITCSGISFLECIYGTKLLKRLESIKEAVDPHNIFNCPYCIGHTKTKGKRKDTAAGFPGVVVKSMA